MSLWGPGKNHCSIKGHKKGINLNLVYNAMPFKLIHLACAPELPATPSIPHSLCQRSLSAGGVNVNSATAWAECLLLSQEEKMKTERKKKNGRNYRNKSLFYYSSRWFYSLISFSFTPTVCYACMYIHYSLRCSLTNHNTQKMKVSLNAEELCVALL